MKCLCGTIIGINDGACPRCLADMDEVNSILDNRKYEEQEVTVIQVDSNKWVAIRNTDSVILASERSETLARECSRARYNIL